MSVFIGLRDCIAFDAARARAARNEATLVFASAMLFVSLWIDKGFGLIIGGFVPNPMNRVRPYWPTTPETWITVGIWAIGLLILSMLYKIVISVRIETGGIEVTH